MTGRADSYITPRRQRYATPFPSAQPCLVIVLAGQSKNQSWHNASVGMVLQITMSDHQRIPAVDRFCFLWKYLLLYRLPNTLGV